MRSSVEVQRVAEVLFWVVLAVGADGVYCAEDSGDRTDNGEERGSNSKLAVKVEGYVQIVIGSILFVALLGYCWCNVRKARKDMAEEERGDVEGANIKKAASIDPNWRADPERITRGHPEQYADLATTSKRNFNKDDADESHDPDVKNATSASELPGGGYIADDDVTRTHLV